MMDIFKERKVCESCKYANDNPDRNSYRRYYCKNLNSKNYDELRFDSDACDKWRKRNDGY